MTDRYLDSGATPSSPYTTPATAANDMDTLIAGPLVAGDDIYVADDHSESEATVSWSFPGTPASPNRVISVANGANMDTYTKATVTQFTATGSGDIAILGSVQFYGCEFTMGDDFLLYESNDEIVFDDCKIELTSTGSPVIGLGGNPSSEYIFRNCVIDFVTGATAGGISTYRSTKALFEGGEIQWGTAPATALVSGVTPYGGSVIFKGVDISEVDFPLVAANNIDEIDVDFIHCLLNSSATLTTGTQSAVGGYQRMIACDDTTGNDVYRYERENYYGTITADDAVYRTGGASDGTTQISWKMSSNGNTLEYSQALISDPIVLWNTATTSTTFTINVVWDSAPDLQTDEVWMELEYMDLSTDTHTAFANDRAAAITTAPVDHDNNTETWTGTGGFANENKITLSVTVTPGRAGPVTARVYLAKPSTDIYVDPKIETS